MLDVINDIEDEELNLTSHEGLNLHIMDVVIAYLYNSLDNDIYMKLHERFKLHKTYNEDYQQDYSIKISESHYRLK
ncbi:hypothetical protein CR513_39230, partial [Mucuna pruriens]